MARACIYVVDNPHVCTYQYDINLYMSTEWKVDVDAFRLATLTSPGPAPTGTSPLQTSHIALPPGLGAQRRLGHKTTWYVRTTKIIVVVVCDGLCQSFRDWDSRVQ